MCVLGYVHRNHSMNSSSIREIKNAYLAILVVIVPLLNWLPFSTRYYLVLEGYGQLIFVVASVALRMGVCYAAELWGASPKWGFSEFTLLIALLVIDLAVSPCFLSPCFRAFKPPCAVTVVSAANPFFSFFSSCLGPY